MVDLSAGDDSASGDEDSVINGSVIANDSTTSGGTLTYAVATGVANGALVFNADGSYSYTPDANFNGADSFTYTVTDAASGESSTQTVSLTVNPVNDAPTISAPALLAAVEDIASPLTGFSVADIDAGTANVVATLTVASGTLSASSSAGVAVAVFNAGGTLSLTGSVSAINAFIAAAEVSYTSAPDASGDVALTLRVNDNGNTGSGGIKFASTNSVIQIAPVADAPLVNVEFGTPAETTTTINNSNANSAGQGFTVSAFSLNGNVGEIAFNDSPIGFGVAGGASGDNTELGQRNGNSERLNVVFDTAASSATVTLAWLNPSERAEYKLFDSDDTLIGGGILSGVTDQIDPPVTLTSTNGSPISRIEFTAPSGGDNDYLIHSISYVSSSSYPVTITVTPTDIDNSESISEITVSIPTGATLSNGTQNPDGTWSLPLVSDGSYSVAVDATTKAVTISGLDMTVPANLTGTPSVIVAATVVDGSDTVNAVTGSSGNDFINGSADDDILSGGLGNDTLSGGTGADTFLWRSGETGDNVITDFNASEGDSIDLRDLLQGETDGTIDNFLQLVTSAGGTSTLLISTEGHLNDGGGTPATNADTSIELTGVNLSSSSISSLIAGADPTIKIDHT